MKYEPKEGDQWERFNQTVDKLLSVPYEDVQKEIKEDQQKRVAKKKKAKTSGRASSRDSA